MSELIILPDLFVSPKRILENLARRPHESIRTKSNEVAHFSLIILDDGDQYYIPGAINGVINGVVTARPRRLGWCTR